jgi:hypothetical protein
MDGIDISWVLGADAGAVHCLVPAKGSSGNRLVYTCGNVGVVYDVELKTQKLLRGHVSMRLRPCSVVPRSRPTHTLFLRYIELRRLLSCSSLHLAHFLCSEILYEHASYHATVQSLRLDVLGQRAASFSGTRTARLSA